MLTTIEQALAQAEKIISQTMMQPWQIGNKTYLAVYDETPQRFEGFLHYNEEYRVNGTKRTLTLFRSSGYSPHIGDIARRDNSQFVVKAIEYLDDLIILQLE